MSTPTPIPKFGRTWNLNILSPDGQTAYSASSSDNDIAALRITFDLSQYVGQALWQGEINIWNLNWSDNSQVQGISQGSVVSLSAGYQSDGNPGQVWKGEVYQSYWWKPDSLNNVLTLRFFVGVGATRNNMSQTFAAGIPQIAMIQKVAEAAGLSIGHIDPGLQEAPTSPRSVTVFGDALSFLKDVARTNGFDVTIDAPY